MNKNHFYWLSFVVDAKAENLRYLGACFVIASSPTDAAVVALKLGIYPGGDTKIVGPLSLPAEFTRVLTKSEFFEKLLDETGVDNCGKLFDQITCN